MWNPIASLREVFAAPKQLAEERAIASANEQMFTERLADIQLALDADGWRQLGSGDYQLDRHTLDAIAILCRTMWIKNPHIKRLASIYAMYTWALPPSLPTHDNVAMETQIRLLIADSDNQREVFGEEARICLDNERSVTGNLFFVVTNGNGTPQIRMVPFRQIRRIINVPDDYTKPMLYRREWSIARFDPEVELPTLQLQVRYYYDAAYAGPKVAMVAGFPVDDAVIVHRRASHLSDMQYGVPDLFAAVDWARAYKDFLTDWASLNRALAQFAWRFKTDGGKKAIARVKTLLQTGVTPSSPIEHNANTTTGAIAMMDRKGDMEPIKTNGMTPNPEGARRIALQVATAGDVTEAMFGDISTGPGASSQQLDRPMELMILMRQAWWRETYVKLATAAFGWNPVDALATEMTFPDIVSADVGAVINAAIDAATMKGLPLAGGMDIKTFMQVVLAELGVGNANDVIESMYPESSYDPSAWAVPDLDQQRATMAAAQQDPSGGGDPNADPSSKSTRRPGRTDPRAGKSGPK